MKKTTRKRVRDKLFVVRKFVKANSALQAIRREKDIAVHDVYIDSDWEEKHKIDTYAVGFGEEGQEDNYEGEWGKVM